MSRRIVRIVKAQNTSDGAGVRLRRSIGAAQLDHLDPFLLLDEFRSDQADDYIAGFPDHPHRGFETVTYMLAGRMEHRDHMGNVGNLRAGSVQWMTAGSGILHSEMPKQEGGLMWGFQLWINLPAKEKMCPPRYQDIPPEEVPEIDLAGGGRVRLMAGNFQGRQGPVQEIVTNPRYLDVVLPANAVFDIDIPDGHTAFCYCFDGSIAIGPEGDTTSISEGRLAVLSQGEGLRVHGGENGGRFLFLAALPLREPVARYGPFVMNTRDEILRAFEDFQNGALGRATTA